MDTISIRCNTLASNDQIEGEKIGGPKHDAQRQ
jgi:hypothetical protein